MKEQSHKTEMAEALRDDFARLRGRGVATSLGERPGSGEAREEVAEPKPEPPTPVGGEDAARGTAPPGWVGRLLGRR